MPTTQATTKKNQSHTRTHLDNYTHVHDALVHTNIHTYMQYVCKCMHADRWTDKHDKHADILRASARAAICVCVLACFFVAGARTAVFQFEMSSCNENGIIYGIHMNMYLHPSHVLCVYIWIYQYTCTFINIYTHTGTHILHVCCVYTYMYTGMSMYVYTYTHVYTCICTYM